MLLSASEQKSDGTSFMFGMLRMDWQSQGWKGSSVAFCCLGTDMDLGGDQEGGERGHIWSVF